MPSDIRTPTERAIRSSSTSKSWRSGYPVNLDGLIELRGRPEYLFPVGLKSCPNIINSASRMTEDLYVRILERSQIPPRLIFLSSQRRMETSQDQVKPAETWRVHIALSLRIQVQLNRVQNSRVSGIAGARRVCGFDFRGLISKLRFVDALAIFRPLEWSVMAMYS